MVGRVRVERLEGRLLFAAGDPDLAFGGGDGVADVPGAGVVNVLAVDDDGSVVAAGHSSTVSGGGAGGLRLVRYRPDGTPDTAFGAGGDDGDGVSTFAGRTRAEVVAIDPQGRILVAGSMSTAGMVIARFNPDGTPDESFGQGAEAEAYFGHHAAPHAIRFEPDGKILVGVRVSGPGDPSGSDATARFNPDGTNDLSYGFNGTRGDVTLRPDDGGLADIGDYNFRVPDPFGEGVPAARVESPAVSAVRLPDGRIVALDLASQGPGAPAHLALLRFNADGTPDPTFAHSAVAAQPFFPYPLALQPGTGRILVARRDDFGVMAFQPAPPLDEPRPLPPDEDAAHPVAAGFASDVTGAGATGVLIRVVYHDNMALLESSFDLDDVRITAPDGTVAGPAHASLEGAGEPYLRTVYYTYVPPGGEFTAAMNGVYTVSIEPGQVFDTSGNAVVASSFTFSVQVDPPQPPDPPEVPVPTDAPNLVAGPVMARFRRGGTVAAGPRPLGLAWFAVTNAGDRRLAGPVAFTLVASADDQFDAGDTGLASFSRRLVLRPNRTRHVRVRLGALPPTMVPGDYHLLARLDPANALAETSETDNVTPSPSPLLHVTLPGAASQRARNDDLFGTTEILAR